MRDFLGEEAKRTESEAELEKITIRETRGQSSFTQTMTADDGSKSRLGAKEVYLSELKAAQDAIERQDIPAGYREYLRKYFEAIQPDEAGGSGEGR